VPLEGGSVGHQVRVVAVHTAKTIIQSLISSSIGLLSLDSLPLLSMHQSPKNDMCAAQSVDYEVPAATKNVATVEEESEEESTVEGEDNEDEGMDQDNEEDEENEEEEEEEEEERHTKLVENAKVRALQKARNVTKTRDSAAVRAAELEAEAAGVDFATFDKATKVKSSKIAKVDDTKQKEEEMNKMMMGNKQRKLYEKMKYGERKRNEEKMLLQQRKAAIDKAKKKEMRKKSEGRS